MSMNFEIVRYNFINHKVRKPLRIVMIADLHNQVYGTGNEALLSAIGTEQPDKTYDFDGDGELNVSDVSTLVNFILDSDQ